MKLLIDGDYKEVGFWSFMKCNFITSFVLGLLIWLVWAVVLAFKIYGGTA